MSLPLDEIGKRLRTVRKQLDISLEKMASACGVASNVYAKLEEGRLDPLPGDYILIAARVLKTDFRYFISNALDDVEEGTCEVFRALADPKPSDLLAVRRFMLFCLAEAELEEILNRTSKALPPVYPRSGVNARLHKEQGKQAAIVERDRLSLGRRPITNVFDIIRSQGVRLNRHALQDANLSGVTVAHPRAGVCVLVNYEEDLFRQFFSAAHEYGHVLFDREKVASAGCIASYRFSRPDLIEIRANNFAAEFLLPTAAMAKFQKPRNTDQVVDIAREVAIEYRVNAETVAIRMKEIDWISDRTLASFQQTRPVVIRRSEKRDPDLPNDLSEVQAARFSSIMKGGVSSHFVELLRRALNEEVISFGRFSEMIDMTSEEAMEFVREIGIAL